MNSSIVFMHAVYKSTWILHVYAADLNFRINEDES